MRREILFDGDFRLELVEDRSRFSLVVTDCVSDVPQFIAACTPMNLFAVLRGIRYHIVGGDNISTFCLDGEHVLFRFHRHGQHVMSCRIPAAHFYSAVLSLRRQPDSRAFTA